MNYKTPGVYIEEVSLLPPSVAQVETAIPAFIGYTEQAKDENGNNLWNIPQRIKSLRDYEQIFGYSNTQSLEVTLSDDAPYLPLSVGFTGGAEQPYRMYQALQMYFANGGGPCYIVAVGDFDDTTPIPSLDNIDDYTELKKGLDAIRKIDEVTLIIFPEADRLNTIQYYDLYKDVLMQCQDLKDRFGVFDLLPTDTDGSSFRDNIGVNSLSYGAAYYPYLNTSLPHPYNDASVTLSHGASDAFNGATIYQLKTVSSVLESQLQIARAKTLADDALINGSLPGVVKAEKLVQYKIAFGAAEKSVKEAQNALELIIDDSFTSVDLTTAVSDLQSVIDDSINPTNTNAEIDTATSELASVCSNCETAIIAVLAQVNTEQSIGASRNTNIQAYFTNSFIATINTILQEFTVVMPPSSAVVGLYARTDSTRGVWKAPANLSINLVNGPTVKVDNSDNDNFNVHPTGKSINVIRSFTGKGTLVWGARTLDGNNNEWRYVSVRRFFNMVEESVKKASEQFVFENNDANTWVKVKAMIENFLIIQWRDGALMGSKPEEAFFVKVGLGETMTQEDVFNGNMIVEIGMAVVRPAEFIILRFSHKMLES